MREIDIASAKRGLRERLRAERAAMPAEERAKRDAALYQHIVQLPEFAQASVLFTYLSIGSEVDTRAVIEEAWRQGKVVALPVTVPGTRELRWYKATDFEGLIPARFGVEEPDPARFEEVDARLSSSPLALVPGLTFDRQGYRLGYGGGFYDTFLAGFDGATVGLCREAQLTGDLRAEGAIEAHDLPVQLIVTDARVIRV